MLETPVLFLIFNRPDVTARVFAAIRKARPRRLFIAADGPRSNRDREAELCDQTRAVVANIDWSCDVQLRFQSENLGCRLAVSSAITWFFDQVDRGIILEDDCLPNESFFPFCEELLNRYADDTRIMQISGDNFQKVRRTIGYDYYFSIFNHIWGWATWRRAWKHYDVSMTGFNQKTVRELLYSMKHGRHFVEYWLDIFDRTHQGKIDTWDYQWTYSIWCARGLTILPSKNLISNIGFDANATHTTSSSWLAQLPTESLVIARHPLRVTVNQNADRYTAKCVYGLLVSAWSYWLARLRATFKIRTRIRSIFRRGRE